MKFHRKLLVTVQTILQFREWDDTVDGFAACGLQIALFDENMVRYYLSQIYNFE